MNTGRMRLFPDTAPFALLPPALARRLLGGPGLLLLTGLALALGEPMRAHSDAAATAAAPWGILSLQFAWGGDAVRGILASWDAQALAHARLSLRWDMAFAPAYGLALAALSERIAARAGRLGASVPVALAWLPLAAAAADLLENALHLRLLESGDAPAAAAAFILAQIKWGLLAAWLAGAVAAGLRLSFGAGRRR